MAGTITLGGQTLASHDTASNTSTLTVDEANVGSNALVVDSSGNVGVGTSNPNGALTVKGVVNSHPNIGDEVQVGAAGGWASIEMSGSNGGLIDFNAGDGTDFKGRILYDVNNNVFDFHVNSSLRMRIDSSGGISKNGNFSYSGSNDDFYNIASRGPQ